MNETEEIIKEAYAQEFGAAYETYRQIVKEHPNIRLQDVKDYLNSRQDIQVKIKYKKIIFLIPVSLYLILRLI